MRDIWSLDQQDPGFLAEVKVSRKVPVGILTAYMLLKKSPGEQCSWWPNFPHTFSRTLHLRGFPLHTIFSGDGLWGLRVLCCPVISSHCGRQSMTICRNSTTPVVCEYLSVVTAFSSVRLLVVLIRHRMYISEFFSWARLQVTWSLVGKHGF